MFMMHRQCYCQIFLVQYFYDKVRKVQLTGCAGALVSSVRGFLDELRLRLPLPLLRRFGRGGPLPPGRFRLDVDWISSVSCDNVPKSCTGGRSTAAVGATHKQRCF